MKRRSLLIVLTALLCLAALSTVSLQRAQLTALRAEQSRLLAESATPSADSAHSSAAEITTAPLAAPAPAVSSELLRLRREVTRLTRLRDELGLVTVENQRLRAQATNAATNAVGSHSLPPGYLGADQGEVHVVGPIDMNSITFPPGYVRASQARMAGYNTPENTIESMLWAVHNRDLTNLLQAFTPEAVQEIQKQTGRSGGGLEAFLQSAAAMPGLSIVSREQMSDGSIRVKAEIAPGMPFSPIRFRQINGQWKMEMDGRGGQ